MDQRHLVHTLRAASIAALLLGLTTSAGWAFFPGVGLIGDGTLNGAKVAEDSSPLPRDRIFFNYNYFDSVAPNVAAGTFREVIGFEKTFLQGNGSIEIRLPFQQFVDPNAVVFEFGDPTIVFKYALIND